MTLNALEPTDQRLVSELPAYIRATRAALNAIEAADADISINTLNVAGGVNALVIGVDLADIPIEVIFISGLGALTLEFIRGATEGQVKIFIFMNANVTLRDGIVADGRLYLNQLPVASDYNAQPGDVLTLVNIGGNGALIYGYWRELFRTLAVK